MINAVMQCLECLLDSVNWLLYPFQVLTKGLQKMMFIYSLSDALPERDSVKKKLASLHVGPWERHLTRNLHLHVTDRW